MAVLIENVEYLTIGEVSSLIGRSPQTIKRWEDQGKIPSSTRQQSNNWRIYSPEDVAVIKKYSHSLNKPGLQADLLEG